MAVIEHRCGEYDTFESGGGKDCFLTLHICQECFNSKLAPFLKENGVEFNYEEDEWGK